MCTLPFLRGNLLLGIRVPSQLRHSLVVDPLLRKILNTPASLPGSLLGRLPSLIVSYLSGKRRCLLSVVILRMRKQSFVIDCCGESKPCHDHFVSFITSSEILFNPVQTGPLGFFFFKSLTVEVELGGLWRSTFCNSSSITAMTDHEIERFYNTFKTMSSRSLNIE